MRDLLVAFARTTGMLIEAAAVVVVAYGAVEAFVRFGRIVINPGASHGERKALWRRLGMWLLLGLEFELAADIIGSIVSPTWYEIGRLGEIAVIRTFLNYFLERDLEHAAAAATVPATGGEARLASKAA